MFRLFFFLLQGKCEASQLSTDKEDIVHAQGFRAPVGIVSNSEQDPDGDFWTYLGEITSAGLSDQSIESKDGNLKCLQQV